MRGLAIGLIKGVHTVAFAIIAGAILTVFVDGLRGRPSRRTGWAATIALAECAVYAGNGFVCPLTPLAERLGATNGAVSDIFLPDRVARNLPWIATPTLITGLVLNVAAQRQRGSLIARRSIRCRQVGAPSGSASPERDRHSGAGTRQRQRMGTSTSWSSSTMATSSVSIADIERTGRRSGSRPAAALVATRI